ncbi:formate hydrogenase [Leptospira perolatii]|uniref:formate hydrogenase n=1 Tax=Leptospira perolatii TaxID=2023191 RepID=UPI001A9C7EBA|nr:formate hydrogenase [Leptospira perolatii]
MNRADMLFDIVYLLLLLTGVVILIENRLKRVLQILTLQGMLLAISVLQVHKITEYHTWILIGLILIFKILLSPIVLYWVSNRMRVREGTHPRVGSTATLFFLITGILFAVGITEGLEKLPEGIHRIDVVYVLLLIYVGILTFIVRTHWIALVAGFVIFENGTFLLTLLLHGGLPFGVELGAFVDALLVIVSAAAIRIRTDPRKHAQLVPPVQDGEIVDDL